MLAGGVRRSSVRARECRGSRGTTFLGYLLAELMEAAEDFRELEETLGRELLRFVDPQAAAAVRGVQLPDLDTDPQFEFFHDCTSIERIGYQRPSSRDLP